MRLAGARLAGARLAGVRLAGVRLAGARLAGARWRQHSGAAFLLVDVVRRHHEDARARFAQPEGVVGAGLDRDPQSGGGVRERLGEAGRIAGRLEEGPADVGAVEGELEGRPEVVDQVEEDPALGKSPSDRRRPLGLLLGGGAEVVLEVLGQASGAGAGLCEACSVGVEAEQEVPGHRLVQRRLCEDAVG
ncbi:pentapeptide repeat-containing protein [Kitasatospora sp. NPDC091276]|uniref:pentapeptide repeat-containing protein n=1 Tax=Kitasatospora sp. NPDC091276 TaxID=3155300 RepID=UPI0034175FBD